MLREPWSAGDLLGSSVWLQLRVAAASNAGAVVILAERSRAKRTRNTARNNRS